ncbi:hypothetical protein [Flavobacterium oreochromis]|uniref:hypothetical protein n=1 Tax=Flavobacterium oreochromis TaxID=2906078 RepID=UPI00385F9DDA
MQTNEHNPIAIRIGKIQKIWKEEVIPYHFKYINILTSNDDMSIIEGFLKLEASQYGTLQAVFHIMLTSFHDIHSFSYHLIQHWIEEFEKEKQIHTSLDWKNLEDIKNEFSLLDKKSNHCHTLLAKMIEDYKQCFVPDIPFYLGIKPIDISNKNELEKWFEYFLPLLPKDVTILTVDVHEKKDYESFLKIAKEKGKNIIIPSLNMTSAYNELMTQGNPSDPQVEYRKCIMEMGKATGEKNIENLRHWGKKTLSVTQSTGNRTLWASAHIVYAGFLLNFSEYNSIDKLLNKGIQILSSEEKEENTMLLLQFYTMKATTYNIQNETEKAIDSFIKQINLAKEKNMHFAQIQGYLYLFLIATPSNMPNYKLHVKNAYECGIKLDHEMLKSLNFGFIADIYLEQWAIKDHILYKETEEQMLRIYGEEWQKTINQTRLTIKNNKNVIS